jgi:hypothetical protein
VKDALEAAEKRIKGFLAKAPESYEVAEDSWFADEANAEAAKPVLDMLKQVGANQEVASGVMDMFSDLAGAMAEVAGKGQQVDLMNHWGLTGDEFQGRLDAVNAWANENLEPETFDALAAMGPNGIIMAESQMLRSREGALWKPGGGEQVATGELSDDQVKEIMQSDAYQNENAEGHADARAKVRAHFVATTPDPTKPVLTGKHVRAG